MVLDALIWAMVLMIFCTWCLQFTRYNLAYEYLCFPPPAFQALACLNNEIRVVCGWCNSSCCTHLFGVDVFCITWIYLNAYVSSVTYVWRTWEHIYEYVPFVTYVCMAYVPGMAYLGAVVPGSYCCCCCCIYLVLRLTLEQRTNERTAYAVA